MKILKNIKAQIEYLNYLLDETNDAELKVYLRLNIRDKIKEINDIEHINNYEV